MENSVSYNILTGLNVASCESMLFGYSSIEHYSSAYDVDVDTFLSDMGYSDWTSVHQYPCETYWNSPMILMESLFSDRYVLFDRDVWGYRKILSEPLKSAPGVSLYENRYRLPFGYNVAGTMGKKLKYGKNPFENQNLLLGDMLGRKIDCYRPAAPKLTGMDPATKEEKWVIPVSEDGPLYIFPIHAHYYTMNCSVSVNGRKLQDTCHRFSMNAIYLGDFHAGDKVHLSFSQAGEPFENHYLYAAQLDTGRFEEAVKELQSGCRSDIHVRRNKIYGTYRTEKSTTVLLSIPYEKNWSIHVDGKKVQARKLGNIFTGIDLSAGKHTISMHYTAPGMRAGIVLSVLSVAVLLILEKPKRKGRL